MSSLNRWVGGCLLGLAAASMPVHAGDLGSAIGDTKPIIDARVRYESVDQTPIAEEADADTLRLRLGFETGKAWNTALLAEGEFVWPFDGDYRSDTAVPTNLQYPVVADPESYELNRLQLVNTSLPNTTLTLGRQRILLDDHRFVGNVGWRQNEQTFDAVRIVNKPLPALTFDVSYLSQVNRIFGPDSAQGRYEGDGYLANVAWQFPVGKLTGFGYVLDFEPIAGLPLPLSPLVVSSETYGLRFAGERTVSKVKLAYVASYATQAEYGDNPRDFDLDYRTAELTASYRQFSFGLGMEVLEGDGAVGFSTPLATLHKFQGWADKFLGTPANGMDDRYATFGLQMKALGAIDMLSAAVVYHDLQTDRASIDLGSELNLQLQARWQRFTGTLKYADYDAKEGETPAAYQDTTKLWLMLEYVW